MPRWGILALALTGCGSSPDPFTGRAALETDGGAATGAGGTVGSGGTATVSASGGAAAGAAGGASSKPIRTCRSPLPSGLPLDCVKECDVQGLGRKCSPTGCGPDTGLAYHGQKCDSGYETYDEPIARTRGCGPVMLPEVGALVSCCCE